MIKKLKKAVRTQLLILESIDKRLFAQKYTQRLIRSAEHIKSGNSADHTYYVIKRDGKIGFFSNYFYVLGHCMIAEENGWIPVVDMENYQTPYNEEVPIYGTMNAWEYYFVREDSVNLKAAMSGENVIKSGNDYPFEKVPYYSIGMSRFPDKKLVEQLGGVLGKYAAIRPELKLEFETLAAELQVNKCVGVHIRGTDMYTTFAHPVPPSLKNAFRILDRKLAEDPELCIFLCTDEVKIEQQMKDRYGAKVRCTDAYRSKDGSQGIHLEKNTEGQRLHHHYLLGKEVLRDAYLLSKCRALVAGHSNVPYAAIVMNQNKYSDVTYY